MRRVELLTCLGLIIMSASALAQQPATLTCRDANEITGKHSMDGFNLSVLASVTEDSFRHADAARAGEGRPTFMQDWTHNRLTGEVIAVVVSCQKHPADTLEQRAAAIFDEYAVLHSQ